MLYDLFKTAILHTFVNPLHSEPCRLRPITLWDDQMQLTWLEINRIHRGNFRNCPKPFQRLPRYQSNSPRIENEVFFLIKTKFIENSITLTHRDLISFFFSLLERGTSVSFPFKVMVIQKKLCQFSFCCSKVYLTGVNHSLTIVRGF